MDPVTASFIGALVVALIGAVGTYAWNRHRPTVDRNVTTIDGFDKLVQRLQTDNNNLRERVTAIERDVAREKNHSRTQDARLGALQRAVESWTKWGNWLHTEWSAIRLNERPPDLPKTED